MCIKFIYILILIFLISSCKTMEGRKTEKSAINLNETSSEKRFLKERIKEWEDYMNLTGHKDLSLDTILRLTEGYLEAKDILYKKDMEEYEKALAAEKGSLKEEIRQPEQDYSSIIRHFRILSDEYRYRKGADAVHYALGYALYEQGERDEAVKVFEGIIKNYPQSIYLPEVNFRLGEFYFETGQMGEARDSYRRVLNYPQSIFYDKAVYKLGWVYYKIDDFKNASDLFMSLIDRTWEGKFKEAGLTDDSVSCLVMSLTHFNKIDEAVEYLQSKGVRGYATLVLEKIGEVLTQETRYENAIYVYDSLIKNFPDNPNIPFMYEKMAALLEVNGDKETAIAKREILAHQYNYTTAWYKKNHPDGSEKIDSLIFRTIVDVSKEYHLKGKSEANIKYLQSAIDGYRNFLLLFPKSQNYKEINLLLAEALFDAGTYNEAAMEYEKTAKLYQETLKRGDIAYSAFLTHAVIFNKSEGDRRAVINNAARILEAYEKDFSLSGKLEKAHYTISDMYARIKAYDKARDIIMPLTKGKDFANAYKRIAELYLEEGNLGSSEDIYSKLFSTSKDPELQEILAKLRYRLGDEYLKAGKLNEAVEKFNSAFTVYPDSDIGEGSLMKIGHIHIQRKNISGIRDVVGRMAKAYPNSSGSLSLLVEAGQQIENDEPLKAAMLYEEASSITSDSKNIQKLLFAAGIIYEKNKEYNKAVEVFKKCLLKNEIPPDREAEARYRLGYSQIKLGKKEEGMETFSRLKERSGQTDNIFVAKAEFLILKERINVYLDMKITQPFEETLSKKTELLNHLIKDYSDMARYKMPELLTEMFFSMGIALENFRDSILHSERPSDLTKEELEEYSFLLEEKAYPYDEKAVRVYENSLQISREYKVYNEWMRKGLERLVNLRPALYKRGFAFKDVKPVFIYPEPVMMEAGHAEQRYSKN
ncbi:MAG: tetratricopeptide repeat protein [Nitrospinae bacterium]|nr:tetratricopeptide repeat protein [Nitrospinota bacterium]